jgi:hypothetical protein
MKKLIVGLLLAIALLLPAGLGSMQTAEAHNGYAAAGYFCNSGGREVAYMVYRYHATGTAVHYWDFSRSYYAFTGRYCVNPNL